MGGLGSSRGSSLLTRRTANGGLSLTLRDEGDGDETLLRQLFETGSGASLLSRGFPPTLVGQLIAQQLLARERGHSSTHPRAQRQIVLAGGHPVGRLSVDRSADPWYVVDLAVLPAARGRGVATQLLARMQAEAAAAGVAIELHVAAENPARSLYQRNGFEMTTEEGPDLRMRWAAR
jgi:ribosomal protein S18 acetylase RimI-like enzyme